MSLHDAIDLLIATAATAAILAVCFLAMPREEAGVCRKCGCTDARACAGGCFWVNSAHTLCSACLSRFSWREFWAFKRRRR